MSNKILKLCCKIAKQKEENKALEKKCKKIKKDILIMRFKLWAGVYSNICLHLIIIIFLASIFWVTTSLYLKALATFFELV